MRISASILLTDQTIKPAELARALEDSGFSGLYLPEHSHIPTCRSTPFPLGGPLPDMYGRLLDPFTSLAAAAIATVTLRLGTAVCLAAQHDPIALAKTVATLDLLSERRFTLGVGFGWNREEALDHDVAFGQRRSVVRDHIGVMRALWADRPTAYEGEFARVAPSWCHPKPGQEGCRVLIGGLGAGPKLFKAVVEYGDGWIAPCTGPAELAEPLERMRAAWQAAGRPDGQFQAVPFLVSPHPVPGERLGPPELAGFSALGISEVIVPLLSADSATVLAEIDLYAPLVEESQRWGARRQA